MDEGENIKSWVGGVCIKGNQLLLIHRINNDVSINKEYFVFPGKEVAGDETIDIALKKAFEDFSMTIQLGELLYSKDDDIHEVEHYYLCEHILGEPAVAPESNEAKEMEDGSQVYIPMWVPLSELENLIVYPESVKMKILEED